MKAMVVHGELQRGIDIVRRASEGGKSAYFPGATFIRFATADPFLELTATNLETTITARIGARIDEEGEICLPGRLAFEYVRSVSGVGDHVNLEPAHKDSGKTYENILRCGRSRSTFQGMNPQDFPLTSESDEVGKCTVGSQDLRTAINQVVFAAAKDEARPVLQGCQLTIGDVDFRLTATDGFRLATRKGLLLSQDGNAESAVLPKRALNEVARLIRDQDVPVTIVLGKSVASFRMGEGTAGYVNLTCQLLQGTYPEWEKLIPKDPKSTLLLDRPRTERAMKSAAIFARGTNNIIRLRTSMLEQEGEDGTQEFPMLNIRGQDSQVGEMSNVIPILALDGEQNRIAFDSRYVIEGLSIIGGDKAIMDLGEDKTAAVLRIPDTQDYLQVVMPMFVEWPD